MITDPAKGLVLQIKFFKLPSQPVTDEDEDEDTRVRFRIIKKKGTLEDQYELIKELLEYLGKIIIDEGEEEEAQQ